MTTLIKARSFGSMSQCIDEGRFCLKGQSLIKVRLVTLADKYIVIEHWVSRSGEFYIAEVHHRK